MHECHANGCFNQDDMHAELPFCKFHFKKLPIPLQKKLWGMRSRGECGLCEFGEAFHEWLDLTNLSIAILCFVEYGDHDCPKDFLDKSGFCWACGIHDPEKSFGLAKKIVKKWSLI
jgi:hypothetical protein